MYTKRGWLLFLVFLVLVVIIFNLKFSGFNILNTTSNVSVTVSNYPPTIAGVTSPLYVCEGDALFFLFTANDLDGNPLTGSINPQDPFFVIWFSQQTPNDHTFAVLSGTIDKNDIGGVNHWNKTYNEVVMVNDGYNSTCCSDSEQTNITVIEINNIPQVENIGVKTVWTQGENSTFYELWSVTDTEYNLGYGSLNYNVSIKNSSGNPVNFFNISSQGVINFTANTSIPTGVYNVTLCVNDTALSNPYFNISSLCGVTGGVNTVCDSFSLTVTNENRAPRILTYYPNSSSATIPADSLYFNITKYDPDGTIPDTYWYVGNSLVRIDSGSSADEFYYNLGCDVSGVVSVSAVITDGLLNASHIWNVTYTNVACPGGGGGGGGGGEGGGGGIPSQNFQISPEFVTTTVFREEGKQFEIKITNTGSVPIFVTSEIKNISDMAILSEENINLTLGQTKTIKLYLYALRKTEPDVYYGKIIFRAGSIERVLNVVLEVKSREPLFDIKVKIPKEFKSVIAGNDMNVLVDLLNVGLYGTAVDVDLVLYITNFDKLVLYESSKEVVAVKTNLSIDRTLHVPFETPKGTYIVLGEAKYGNITISTYDTFNVVEKKYLRVTFFLLILGILVLIILILIVLWRRKKNKEEERRYR
jgi:hypothetical protein